MKDRTRPPAPARPTRLAIVMAIGAAACVVAALIAFYFVSQPTRFIEDGIRKFTESYFAVWSEGDMAAYRAHFAPTAHIAYVHDGAVVTVLERDLFVDQQTKAVTKSTVKMTERMTSFAVDTDGTGAQVTAAWELRRGQEITSGVDRFTLVRDADGLWKIVFLMFYERAR